MAALLRLQLAHATPISGMGTPSSETAVLAARLDHMLGSIALIEEGCPSALRRLMREAGENADANTLLARVSLLERAVGFDTLFPHTLYLALCNGALSGHGEWQARVTAALS